MFSASDRLFNVIYFKDDEMVGCQSSYVSHTERALDVLEKDIRNWQRAYKADTIEIHYYDQEESQYINETAFFLDKLLIQEEK